MDPKRVKAVDELILKKTGTTCGRGGVASCERGGILKRSEEELLEDSNGAVEWHLGATVESEEAEGGMDRGKIICGDIRLLGNCQIYICGYWNST